MLEAEQVQAVSGMFAFDSYNCIDIQKAVIEPIVTGPETPLPEAILQMSQAYGNTCPVSMISDSVLFSQEPASCVLVVEDNRLLGILTERDLVKLAVTGDRVNHQRIKDVMTTHVVALNESEFTDLFVAYSLMRRYHIRHLPILNPDGYPIGIVTVNSLRRALNLSYFLRFRKISEVMSYNIIFAAPSDSILHLASLMNQHRISCVVIAEKEAGKLIPKGIITERDIVQFQSIDLDLNQLYAAQVMSSPLFCMSPEDSLAKAHLKMQELRVRRLVITGEEGELLGLVTQSSLSQVLDPIEIYGILEILHHRVNQLELAQTQYLQDQRLELRKALKNQEFCLYYQPQISLKTAEMIGVEALMRWQSPERGMVSPAEFIPLAESTDFIIDLEEWALETACRQKVLWQQQGLPPWQMSVNISGRHLTQPKFTDRVIEILVQTGVKPEQLKLELTESLLVKNVEQTLDTFRQLRGMGIQIAIDDFGTGYASLGYLQNFPFDTLKIDRCFVSGIDSNPKNATITMAIIQMAHRLKFEVIAEGVETEGEQEFLRSYDCDAIQGYFISRPLPASELPVFWRSHFDP